MDINLPPTPPAPDHGRDDQGPDDHALARLLRAAAAPLRTPPDAARRRQHIALASAAARGERTLSGPSAGRATSRARRFGRGVLRPVMAGGLALSLVAGLVTAVSIGIPWGTSNDDREVVEIAMARGFTPSPVPTQRTEDHVILTVDAERAEQLAVELTQLLDGDPTVLSVRNDRTAFSVPASIAARLETADVESVEDTPLSTFATPVTQSPVSSWGLDRLDAVEERLDGKYQYLNTGSGVRVYVIDTGVRSDHSDLAGRVIPGWSAIEDGRGSEDCNGHGTHVAGTVAGASYGVAKGATIVAVRVLDCNGAGFASSVVSGISWAIANHPGGPGVINLSLGGPANSAIDRAVADATARGLVVVAAAGNEAGDACAVSPARAASAITTGATTSSDARASYSNFGSCVDLFAPGSGITSAWHVSSGASATLSGTSMAAPHVAGLAARLLQADPGAGPSRISNLLTGSAESGSVDGTNGSPNLLANLIDFDEEEIDCAALIEAGADLPEECLDEDGEEGDEDRDGEEGDEAEDGDGRDGEGRPDSIPGLDGRVPPSLQDRAPPGLVRDAPRVNGLSIVVDGTAFIARWQAAVGATSYVVECTAQRPPSWTADTSFSISAEAAARDGRNLTVELPAAQVDGLARCRMAAELDGSIGAWSNTANVPVLLIGEPVEEPEVGEPVAEGGPERNPRAPVTPGPTVNPNVPVTPGPVNPSRGGASVIPQAAAEIESRAANARNLGASGSDGSPGASGGAAGQGNGRKR